MPKSIFPGSSQDRVGSRQGPAGNRNFVLPFPAGYLNSSPASEVRFVHRAKYKPRRPALAWPWTAGQLSASGINSLVSPLTRKRASSSEVGQQSEKHRGSRAAACHPPYRRAAGKVTHNPGTTVPPEASPARWFY